jgi:hypothetical protein
MPWRLYGGVKVQLQSFPTSAPVGGECLFHAPDAIARENPGFLSIRKLGRPLTRSGRFREERNLLFPPRFERGPSSRYPSAIPTSVLKWTVWTCRRQRWALGPDRLKFSFERLRDVQVLIMQRKLRLAGFLGFVGVHHGLAVGHRFWVPTQHSLQKKYIKFCNFLLTFLPV